MDKKKKIKLVFLVFVFIVLSVYADDARAVLSDEAQMCLGCHENRRMTKILENKESLSVFVDISQLKESVHEDLTCSSCHIEFSIENHPQRKFRSKREYTVKASEICRMCHPERQIRAKPVHLSMLKQGKAPVCIDCHGSHSVKRIAGGKVFTDETQYCLSCHGHEFSIKFTNGEDLSLLVDIQHLQSSVHNKLACSDCHFGFSIEQHPQRSFKSKRDYTIAASEICRRCHFDKYTKTLESIHYTLLAQGNLKAPVCVDCHGSHLIPQTGKDRTLSAKRCEKCHREIYLTYASSVHGNALFNEHNLDVPVCADCHKAHNIEDPRTWDYRENVPEICGSCHANREIMNKYGLSTAVVKTYLQDFHGVTLKLYKRQKDVTTKTSTKPIAVCVDCHGIHDINKTTGPNANVIKANLLKRCQKCHPDATEDFPDAWISHYEPSLKRAPLVFAINLFYKIFIPFMIIGLILQILLHIWRYAINR